MSSYHSIPLKKLPAGIQELGPFPSEYQTVIVLSLPCCQQSRDGTSNLFQYRNNRPSASSGAGTAGLDSPFHLYLIPSTPLSSLPDSQSLRQSAYVLPFQNGCGTSPFAQPRQEEEYRFASGNADEWRHPTPMAIIHRLLPFLPHSSLPALARPSGHFPHHPSAPGTR